MPDEAARPSRVHLDSASGLPLHPSARDVLLAALDEGWSDPLRLHTEGRRARLLLDNAREVVAGCLRRRADEVSFVSSGTTACHLGLLGLRQGRARTGALTVHSAVEHSAVLHAAAWPTGAGTSAVSRAETVSVEVDHTGAVDLAAWSLAVARPGVAVACLQAANPEVGTRQPLAEAAQICTAHGVPLMVDASCAIGWDAPPAHGDVVAASAHKWGGPAGVGVLVIGKGARWRAVTPDDEREQGAAGFVNVPGVLAAAAALQAVETTRVALAATLRDLTGWLRAEVVRELADVEMAGDANSRLPHIVNLSCLYIDGEVLVTELDRLGFSVSSGSACTSSTLEPSHVLAAMGVLTHGNVRVSVSAKTTQADLKRFSEALVAVVARLRASAGVAPAGSSDG